MARVRDQLRNCTFLVLVHLVLVLGTFLEPEARFKPGGDTHVEAHLGPEQFWGRVDSNAVPLVRIEHHHVASNSLGC